MTTDTSEKGLERLICAALTGAPCDPAEGGVVRSGRPATAAVTGKLHVREAAAGLPEEADEDKPVDADGLILDNMDDGSYGASQSLAEEPVKEREVTA